MSQVTPGPNPLETAQGLTDALKGMSERLDTVAARGDSTRRITWGVAGSVALDVILTIVLALIAVQAHDASNAASHASASNLALCKAGNVARGQQVQLWDHLIDESKPGTPKEAQTLAAFRAYVHHVFMPRDCVKLGTRKP